MLSMLIFAAASASSPPRVIVLPYEITSKMEPLCKATSPELVDDKPSKPVGVQKLNELPNADAFLTVLRTDENGCSKPAIVAYDIGSAPKRQR